jgi:hypothetical protein
MYERTNADPQYLETSHKHLVPCMKEPMLIYNIQKGTILNLPGSMYERTNANNQYWQDLAQYRSFPFGLAAEK